MTGVIRVSAPGKLFLIGEYAVLHGAPALLSAVDRRVHVGLQPSRDGWRLDAPDLGVHNLPLDARGNLPADPDATRRAQLRLYATVLQHVREYIGAPTGSFAVRTDSAAFSANGHKLGLGSSAAVAAALTAAFAAAAGCAPDTATLCRHAMAAHREFQNGSGSGADVATCVHGGLIIYQRGQVQARPAWPDGIIGMAVVTGAGASTPQLVARVADYARRAPSRHDADMMRLTALAEQAQTAITDADAFLALLRDYFVALQELSRHAAADIVLPRHEQLAALAARHGGVFKTSGAGGGDLGLLFAADVAAAQQLTTAFAQAGARIIPLQFAAPGLGRD